MAYYKRIIYCLYFKDNHFFLSRNFRLQKVGDLNWLIKNFEFGLTASYVDELMIILVKSNPNKDDFDNFFQNVENLKKNIFIPIILGGSIDSLDMAKKFFEKGADKISVNTLSYEKNNTVTKISNLYGSQSISIMVDYKRNENEINLYSHCGTNLQNINFTSHLNNIKNLGIGEIILNSIDNDGNGDGLDLDIVKNIKLDFSNPILLMGGAGKPDHLSEALQIDRVSGIITANLFNFLGTGLNIARKKLIEENINVVDFG